MRNVFTLGMFLLVTACATLPPDCAGLPGGGHYCLQESNANTTFSIQQKVEARFKQHRETLISDIESDSQGIQFVALTPFGQKVVHVQYDNKTATAIRLPDNRIQPAMLLAMLQLTLWPESAVRRGLSSQYTLTESATQRRILLGEEVIIDIRHEAAPAPYSNVHLLMPTADLELDIQMLNADNPAPTP